MTETNLTPALSAEEWASLEWRTHGYEVNSVIAVSPTAHLLRIIQDRPSSEIPFARPTEFHALIALSNHALPDTDARKLTENMALAMTQAAHFLENAKGELSTHWPDGENPWHLLAADLRRHAAAIRALLPPR